MRPPETSVRKPEWLVRKPLETSARNPEWSVRTPETSAGKPETSGHRVAWWIQTAHRAPYAAQMPLRHTLGCMCMPALRRRADRCSLLRNRYKVP